MTGFFILYFTACAANAPDTCETQRLSLDVASARGCLRVAQPQLARWVETHPGQRIAAWRCGAPPRGHGVGTRI